MLTAMGLLDVMASRVAGGAAVEFRPTGSSSNNRGRVNGWTTHARIYGICVAVDGVRRPRLDGKLLETES